MLCVYLKIDFWWFENCFLIDFKWSDIFFSQKSSNRFFSTHTYTSTINIHTQWINWKNFSSDSCVCEQQKHTHLIIINHEVSFQFIQVLVCRFLFWCWIDFFAKNILKYEFHEYFSCFQRCFFRPNKGEEKIRYEFHYSVTHKHAHKWMRKNIEYSSQQQQQQQLVSLCACVWKFDFLIFKKNSHMESKLKNRKFLNSKLSL